MPNETPVPPIDPRVLLAAERTLLAWVRTGLALMGFGFIVARFGLFLREMAVARGLQPPAARSPSLWLGVALVSLGVLALAGAGWRFRRYMAELRHGSEPAAPGVNFAVVMTALLIAIGLALAVYLVGSE